MDAMIEFRGICKSFFGAPALIDVNFTVGRNRTVGLIGENGAGKSTLMNILGGALAPDAGDMLLNGKPYAPNNPGEATRAGVAFIHQELNLFNNLSIADNIFIDRYPKRQALINKKEVYRQTSELLKSVGLSVDPAVTVERLQPGERQMVEICKALHGGARVIIFDEPTTSLTARETEKLFALIERLHQGGATIIYISHILKEVAALCDDMVVLRDGKVVDRGEAAEFDTHRMIASMCGCDLEMLFPERSGKPGKNCKFEVKNLSSAGQIENVCFQIHDGEIVGLFGLMGAGRTELAKLLFGLDRADRGEIAVAGKPMTKITPQRCIDAGMAFVTENRREEGLLMDAAITDNLALAALDQFTKGRLIDFKKMNRSVAEQAERVSLKHGIDLKKAVKTLSGGNQQKVVIGKWLLTQPQVFILDEPTRGIDVGAKFEVYSLINDLADRGAAILLISSELEELLGLCDSLLVMRSGEIVAHFERAEFEEKSIMRAAFGAH